MDTDNDRPSLAELVARAQNSSLTDPTWRADYRTEDRAYYDDLHDTIPSDIPDTVWESDGLSKGAGA